MVARRAVPTRVLFVLLLSLLLFLGENDDDSSPRYCFAFSPSSGTWPNALTKHASSWLTTRTTTTMSTTNVLSLAATTKTMSDLSDIANNHDKDSNDDDSSTAVAASWTTMTVVEQEHVPTTFVEAFQVFFLGSYNGPRMVVMLVMGLATWRLCLAETFSVFSLSPTDVGTVAATALFWAWQEHFLHGRVLHSNVDWYGKAIHEGHHAKPYHHVSIDPAWLMLSWMGVVHVIFRILLPLPLALTATTGYALSGLWYEFLHFIVHTRVRFTKGSYFQTMKDHHARHHLIDKRFWLGFSLPVVDDLMGTNPSVAQVRKWKQQETQ